MIRPSVKRWPITSPPSSIDGRRHSIRSPGIDGPEERPPRTPPIHRTGHHRARRCSHDRTTFDTTSLKHGIHTRQNVREIKGCSGNDKSTHNLAAVGFADNDSREADRVATMGLPDTRDFAWPTYRDSCRCPRDQTAGSHRPTRPSSEREKFADPGEGVSAVGSIVRCAQNVRAFCRYRRRSAPP